ncbi:hypothetical protein [Agrococcus citreus]|uniref:Uncharacterized protein n=1 Tax=Agrococcus citreus TaxID=84643 RepID=A0ABP4JBW1_9MICO
MHVVQFVLLFLLLVGSFVVMSYAIGVPGLEAVIFIVGLFMFMASILGAVEIGRRGLRR